MRYLFTLLLYGGFCTYLPAQNPPLREADVMWNRTYWRVIDLREKQNQHFYHPQLPEGGRNLIALIRDALLVTQTLAAYDPLYDDFRIQLTLAEIQAIWTETLHQKRQRPYPPYAEYDTVITKLADPGSVKRIKIKEYAFFDRYHSQMEIRIIGLCPVMEKHDPQTGELRGYSDMFWIYFPALKPVLALQKITLGIGTSLQSITYDDVFVKRYFSSFIYKEDNVYDRKVEDYLRDGVERLRESERIKENIRRYEEDLWEQ